MSESNELQKFEQALKSTVDKTPTRINTLQAAMDVAIYDRCEQLRILREQVSKKCNALQKEQEAAQAKVRTLSEELAVQAVADNQGNFEVLDRTFMGLKMTTRFSEEALVELNKTDPALLLDSICIQVEFHGEWGVTTPYARFTLKSRPQIAHNRYTGAATLQSFEFTLNGGLVLEETEELAQLRESITEMGEQLDAYAKQIERLHAKQVDAENARDRIETRFQRMALNLDDDGIELLQQAVSFLDQKESGLSLEDLEDILNQADT